MDRDSSRRLFHIEGRQRAESRQGVVVAFNERGQIAQLKIVQRRLGEEPHVALRLAP